MNGILISGEEFRLSPTSPAKFPSNDQPGRRVHELLTSVVTPRRGRDGDQQEDSQ